MLGNFRVLNNDGDPSTPITVDLEVEITDFEGEMDSVFSYLRGPNYPGALVSPQWTIDKSVTPNIANFSWTLDARSASGIYELESVRLYDVAGNEAFYHGNEFELGAVGNYQFLLDNSISDDDAPLLTDFDIFGFVDGENRKFVTLKTQLDNGDTQTTGIGRQYVRLTGPDTGNIDRDQFVLQDDGYYELEIALPLESPDGDYTVSYWFIYDNALNGVTLSGEEVDDAGYSVTVNFDEGAVNAVAPTPLDTDSDGVYDFYDNDDDNDGVADSEDQFPRDPDESEDTDSDGIGNNADPDDDDDGVLDEDDQFPLDASNGALTIASGKVIDGYISGATVFLDTNFNLVQDVGEVSALTGDNGAFELSLDATTRACLRYSPIVASVPVGAVDLELGEVTEAFKMILPPRFDQLDEEAMFVTPLTTVVWEEIRKIIEQDTLSSASCESLKNNPETSELIQQASSNSIANTVRHYNVPAAKIFSDFVGQGDAEAAEAAQEIVRGLKKSFSETAALRSEYPDADWAYVTYFKFDSRDGGDLYPDAWYREIDYKIGDYGYFELTKVSENLETDLRLINKYERDFADIPLNDDLLQLQRIREIRQLTGGDDSKYVCEDMEEVSLSLAGGAQYQLANRYDLSGAAELSQCSFESFAESTQFRILQIQNSERTESATFHFRPPNIINGKEALTGWYDIFEILPPLTTEDLQTAKSELITTIEGLPYQFCNKGSAGAEYREKIEIFDNRRVTTGRYGDGSFYVRTEFDDGTSDRQEFPAGSDPTRNGCDQFDSDSDGVNDAVDAFPFDGSEIADFDGDGVGNRADQDDDGDDVLDINDAFPFDFAEALDTDGDGIGNNADDDDDGDGILDIDDASPLVADIDSDGDGVLDIFDPLPNNAGNFIDSDGDGVFDFYDVFPSDANVAKTVAFNLTEVSDVAVTESISGDNEIVSVVFGADHKGPLWKTLLQLFSAPATANSQTAELTAETNVVAWSSDAERVADAILSDGTMFVGEAVLSPDAKYVYLLTSTGLQSRLNGRVQLDQEVCQLYRVDISEDNSLLCVVPAGGDIPEINPIIISNSLRDDYTREGVTFRSDGTGLLQAHGGQILISPDGTWELVKSGKTAPDGFVVEDELGFWLDDEHIAISGWIYPEGGGGSQGFWVAINIDTREVVAERDRSGGFVVQRGSTIYDGNNAFTWDGSNFVSAETLSSAVQDPYGGLWDFVENSHSDEATALTEVGSGFTIELTAPEFGHYADSNQSGTGSDIKYKQYYFRDDYVAYKYVDVAKTPIQTINGSPIANNEVYDLGGTAGTLVLADSWSFWAYFKSGLETSDVVIPYTVINSDGDIEDKSFIIPIEAIEAHASEYPEVIDNPTVEDSWEQEPLAIRFATPEARQVTFCVADKTTAQVQCADLSDYDVRVIDLETDRGPRYFPASMYACPDYSCNAYPGVLHVIMSGGRIFGYFKDSTDNQYYQGEALLSDFMSIGPEVMAFTKVQNGAGESEIIAAAASLNPSIQEEIDVDRLSLFAYDYDANTITIDFGVTLSEVAALPEISVTLDDFARSIAVSNAARVAESDSTVRYTLSTEALEASGDASVSLASGFFFVKNSAVRYGWNGPGRVELGDPSLQNDFDNDGVADSDDAFPEDSLEWLDADADGVGNNRDDDDDNDGVYDTVDSGPLNALVGRFDLGLPDVDALRLAFSEVRVIDYIDGSLENVHYLDPTTSDGVMDVSIPAPLDTSNLIDLVGSASSGKAPRILFQLESLPSEGSEGQVSVVTKIYDGSDAVRDNGERVISASASFNWSSDGSIVTFTAPPQTSTVTLVDEGGVAISRTFSNADSDVLRVTATGSGMPASLEVKLTSYISQNLSSLGLDPSGFFDDGSYYLEVEIDGLDLRGGLDEPVSKLAGSLTLSEDPGVYAYPIPGIVRETDEDARAQIRLSRPHEGQAEASLDYKLLSDTATLGVDFTETEGTVEIKPGGSVGFLEIGPVADEEEEQFETLLLNLEAGSGVDVSVQPARILMVD